MSSDSDSDCVITDYKEGDSCIIVTDIPAKRCKLEPEETPNRKKFKEVGIVLQIVLLYILKKI